MGDPAGHLPHGVHPRLPDDLPLGTFQVGQSLLRLVVEPGVVYRQCSLLREFRGAGEAMQRMACYITDGFLCRRQRDGTVTPLLYEVLLEVLDVRRHWRQEHERRFGIGTDLCNPEILAALTRLATDLLARRLHAVELHRGEERWRLQNGTPLLDWLAERPVAAVTMIEGPDNPDLLRMASAILSRHLTASATVRVRTRDHSNVLPLLTRRDGGSNPDVKGSTKGLA